MWATAFSREGDHSTFAGLVELDEGEELAIDDVVVGHTSSTSRTVELAVARVPKRAVRLPTGDEDWPAIHSV